MEQQLEDALPSDLDKLLNGSIDLSGTEVDFSELNALLDPLLFSAAPQASGLDALLLSPPALVSSSPTLNMAGLDSAFGGSPQFMLPTLGSPEAFHLPALDLDALLVPHNSQSFSSLETLAADMPSPHNDSSSDSASDRVGSPEWGHAIPDDEHARGADLLSSLTPRERELLQAQGLDVSGSAPLTREEEKRIRAERRKIRNKDSAKESRRKKAEYMVQLEKRAEASSQLQERCSQLEKENATLTQRLSQMQKYLVELTRSLPSTGGTFPLMMLLMTFCFAFSPSFLTGTSVGLHDAAHATSEPIIKSRVLLSIPDTCPEQPRTSTPAYLRVRRGSLAEGVSFLGARKMPSVLSQAYPRYMGEMDDNGTQEDPVLTPATDNDGGVLVDPSNETQMPTREIFFSDAGAYESFEAVPVLSPESLVQ